MLEDHLALYFTGFSRFASEVAQEQLKVTPHKRAELTAMLQLVDEAQVVITDPSRPLAEFGTLLHKSWQLKRSLTSKISTLEIDRLYEAGLDAGALGGKLLGAGGGGFMLFFVPPERRQALRRRLEKFLCVPFRFATRGSHVVVYEPEDAYDDSLEQERRMVYSASGAE